MFFDPISAHKMALALQANDFTVAKDFGVLVTSVEDLANSAIVPPKVYNHQELAELILNNLQLMATASVAQAYGQFIPEIMGGILQYLERWANGEFDSQSEQQGSEETVAG